MGAPTDSLRAWLDEQGLSFPERVPDTAVRVTEHHVVAGEAPAYEPYNLRPFLEDFRASRPQPYTVLAYSGHGVNSWVVSYFTVNPRLGVFVQSSWGGLYDNDDDRAAKADRLRRRIGAVEALLDHDLHRLSDGQRLLVVDTDVGDRGWEVLGEPDPHPWVARFRPFDDVLAWLQTAPIDTR